MCPFTVLSALFCSSGCCPMILVTPWNSIKTFILDLVSESIMKIKDYKIKVIEDLQENNLKMQKKVEILEKQLLENKPYLNKLDQYNKRNNIEIQGISS